MRILNIAVIIGISGTLVLTQLVGSADAKSGPDPMAQFEQVLESHAQSNKQLAACATGEGLAFDASLEKADIVDASGFIPKSGVTDEVRTGVAAQIAAAPEDPNSAILAKLSPAQQEAWVDAVTNCSMTLDAAQSGGVEEQAGLAAVQRAAAESPEVTAAAQVYVNCMSDQGFKVDADPFVASQAIMDAEDSGTAEASATLDKYNIVWRTCVQPYQDVYDQMLAG